MYVVKRSQRMSNNNNSSRARKIQSLSLSVLFYFSSSSIVLHVHRSYLKLLYIFSAFWMKFMYALPYETVAVPTYIRIYLFYFNFVPLDWNIWEIHLFVECDIEPSFFVHAASFFSSFPFVFWVYFGTASHSIFK